MQRFIKLLEGRKQEYKITILNNKTGNSDGKINFNYHILIDNDIRNNENQILW